MNRAPVTLALVTVLLVAYGAELALGGDAVCAALGLIPARFMSSGDLVPLFAHGLLHNPDDLWHLGGNVVVLLACGLVVEPELGSARFGLLYAVSGVAGAALHVFVDPSSSVALVGASGSIAGVLAVMGAIRPRLIGFAVGFIAWNTWLALSGDTGSASFGTHLGGAFAGVVFVVATRLLGGDLRARALAA